VNCETRRTLAREEMDGILLETCSSARRLILEMAILEAGMVVSF
jgi:hypothetical protein